MADFSCDVCNEAIKFPSQVIMLSKEKMVHLTCAKCTICNKGQSLGYEKRPLMIVEGRIIHADTCFDCPTCKSSSRWEGSETIELDGVVYHNNPISKNVLSFDRPLSCVICKECGRSGLYCDPKNPALTHVHPECRLCDKCSTPLGKDGTNISMTIEKTFHRDCAVCSAKPKCTLTKTQAQNDAIYYNPEDGLPYHGSCMSCPLCLTTKPMGRKRKLRVQKERSFLSSKEHPSLAHSDCHLCSVCNKANDDEHVMLSNEYITDSPLAHKKCCK